MTNVFAFGKITLKLHYILFTKSSENMCFHYTLIIMLLMNITKRIVKIELRGSPNKL